MTSAHFDDQILAFTRGDQVRAINLRKALETIRDHSSDPRAALRANDVLQGRMSVRELSRDPQFAAAASRRLAPVLPKIKAMPAEERDSRARKGRELEEKQRHALEEHQRRAGRVP